MNTAHLPRRRTAAFAVAITLVAAAGATTQVTPITGTPDDDVLVGTPGPDVIDGGPGSDTIDGGDGADVLIGGPGQDSIVAGAGDRVDTRDGEIDLVTCGPEGGVTVVADRDDIVDEACTAPTRTPVREVDTPSVAPRLTAPARTDQPIHVVYDFAANAQLLHDGFRGVPGLSSHPGSHRQHPLGTPFPQTRWIGKVSHREMAGLTARGIANLLRRRMNSSSIGGAHPQGSLVGVDEVGVELEDGGLGPRFHQAMQILSRQRHLVTREPLSRRVLLYVAPKFVANVGARNDRENWDSAMAAARLSGAVFLQMFHADAGRVTGPATAQEWRDYPEVWRSELGPNAKRLRFLFSGVGPQDTQWRNAASTPAGRATLRAGAGAYRLNSAANARAWLRNWNRYTVQGRLR